MFLLQVNFYDWSREEVMVHVPKIMTHTRVRHEHVEQTVEVPIPQTQERWWEGVGRWFGWEALDL